MTHNLIFNHFPLCPSAYSDDVGQILRSTVEQFGIDEWRAAAIANSLHGHVGIYSTIGAKMGILAREHLGQGDIHIRSFAGSTPPESCMNDGLQVSTGSTIGHGLISVESEAKSDGELRPRAEAVFTLGDRSLRLGIKEEYARRIDDDIHRTIKNRGRGTREYWDEIRRLAIGYWAELDRHAIFDVSYQTI